VRLGARVAAGACAIALAAAPLRAQQPDSSAPAEAPGHRPWTVGEHLEYNVKLGIFNVGHASLSVVGIDTVRGVPCYHVIFVLHGHALFYSLSDSSASWFGVRDMVSRRFEQNGNENGRLYTRHYVIDPQRDLWIRNGRDSGATVAEPLDEVSFFYFARTLPLGEGDVYDLPRYFMHDKNPVTIQVVGRQSVSVPAGRFDAVGVRPIFQSSGMFSERGDATVWFSDDSTRTPVRIRSRMAIGSLDFSLRSITR